MINILIKLYKNATITFEVIARQGRTEGRTDTQKLQIVVTMSCSQQAGSTKST